MVYIHDTTDGTNYYVDVEFKETHDYENTITSNPIQSGTPVSDYMYRNPITLTMDIGYSDCLTSYISGQYSQASTRSLSAYQVFRNLSIFKHMLQIYSQLDTYSNMVIKSFQPYRDKSLQNAMRASVTFQEIIVSSMQVVQIASNDPQTTGQTSGSSSPSSAPAGYISGSLKISYFSVANATYKGKTYSIEDYLNKCGGKNISISSKGMSLSYTNWLTLKITGNIIPTEQYKFQMPGAVLDDTAFSADGKKYSWKDFQSKYHG